MKVDDVARCAELTGISLGAEDGEQVFEGITQSFAVVVTELVDDFEEHLERFRVPVGQIGVFERYRGKGAVCQGFPASW